jgi:hypothetical protein
MAELPKNDFDLPYIGIPRLFFAIASLSFMVYMIPGIMGGAFKRYQCFSATIWHTGLYNQYHFGGCFTSK